MALSSFFIQKLCSSPGHDVVDKIKPWIDKVWENFLNYACYAD